MIIVIEPTDEKLQTRSIMSTKLILNSLDEKPKSMDIVRRYLQGAIIDLPDRVDDIIVYIDKTIWPK